MVAAGVMDPARLPAEHNAPWATPWVSAEGWGHTHLQQQEAAVTDQPAQTELCQPQRLVDMKTGTQAE